MSTHKVSFTVIKKIDTTEEQKIGNKGLRPSKKTATFDFVKHFAYNDLVIDINSLLQCIFCKLLHFFIFL